MEKSELDALLATVKPVSTVVKLCMRGDLQAEWERLDEELVAMRRRNVNTLASEVTEEETALAERILELEQEMQDCTVAVRLEALGRKPWRELLDAHQPRDDDKIDLAMGHNRDTFYDALIGACVVEPVLAASQMERFLDALTGSQFDKLANSAWGVNRRDVEVPFSPTASHIITSTGETSKQPSGSASRTAGSADGSRRKSSSTSTARKLAG